MTTTLNVLNRPRLVDDVVKVLREKIIRGELPAGTQLLQIDLANQLGVSRAFDLSICICGTKYRNAVSRNGLEKGGG